MNSAILRLSLALAFAHPVFAAGGLHLLGVEEQTRAESAPAALVAGQPSTLQILVPADTAPADLAPRFAQLAGAIARPLAVEAELLPHPADARVARLRLTPPAVTRVTRLALWLGPHGPQTLVVFPAAGARPREDLAPLADLVSAAQLRILVCGPSVELRAHLRAEKIPFDDQGADPPDRLDADTLLLGHLAAEDWERLSTDRRAPASAHLLAFIDDPALLPGVYVQRDPAGRRHLAKITLPLATLLSTDPRARETFHTLLRQALPPLPSAPSP